MKTRLGGSKNPLHLTEGTPNQIPPMSTPQARSAVKFDLFADAARKRKIETLVDPLQIIAGISIVFRILSVHFFLLCSFAFLLRVFQFCNDLRKRLPSLVARSNLFFDFRFDLG